MNKPNPEFEIDDPTVIDEQGRSPNKNEVIDPDGQKMEAGTARSGEQGEDAADRTVDEDGGGVDDLASEDDLSSSNEGEAGNLGRDAGATQGSQKMTAQNRDATHSPQGKAERGQRRNSSHQTAFKSFPKP